MWDNTWKENIHVSLKWQCFHGETGPNRCTKQPTTPFIIIIITSSSYAAAAFFSVRRQWKDSFTLLVMPTHQRAVMEKKTETDKPSKQKRLSLLVCLL